MRQHLLNAFDIGSTTELLFNGLRRARHLDYQLSVHVEMTCRFHRELRDVFVGDRVITYLLAGDPLFISKNEALLREDGQVSHDLEGSGDRLSLNKNRTKLFVKLAWLDL